nr:SMP-30/gluconolactonase/LRE family protein [Comamonas sp. JC664]
MVDLRTGLISTVAGTPGTAGADGDNGPARQARLRGPSSVFVDTARSIYITDRDNHCVRIVEGDTIRNFAGTPGTAGHAGDVTTGLGTDGTATRAQLNHPTHLTVGPDNVVYIADTGNHCIRTVTTETRSRRVPDPKKPSKTIKVDEEVDVIRTLAGTPGISGHGGDGGPANNAVFDTPTCVVHDESTDSLYVADSSNHVVRAIDLSTGDIDHVAGTPTTSGDQGDAGPADAAELNGPCRLALMKDGSLYVSDTDNHRLRTIVPGGDINAFAGAGTAGFSGDSAGQAANARLNGPQDVAFDDTRNVLYIADTLNHRIRQVDVTTGLITTLAGTGVAGYDGEGAPAANHQLHTPSGLAINTDAGKLYVSDSGNHRVRVIDLASGEIATVAGDGNQASTGDGGAATAASLDTPAGIALDYLTLKDLYVAETGAHCVRVIDLESGDIETRVNTGKASGHTLNAAADQTELDAPTSLALDEVGTLYIADTGNHRVLKVRLDAMQASLVAGTGIASSTGDDGAPEAATLNGPSGLAVDTAGRNLYVAEAAGFVCRKVTL